MREKEGRGRGWARHRRERRCGASISNFLFPDELACVENVACNVTTRGSERERESRVYTLSRHKPGGEENDGGTRRRRPGAAAVAAPRRNTGNVAYFFDDFRTRGRTLVYVYRTCMHFSLPRIHVNGPINPLRLGRRWSALLRRGCHRRKSGNGGWAGEGVRLVVGGGKALGCPWVERGGGATVSVVGMKPVVR